MFKSMKNDLDSKNDYKIYSLKENVIYCNSNTLNQIVRRLNHRTISNLLIFRN